MTAFRSLAVALVLVVFVSCAAPSSGIPTPGIPTPGIEQSAERDVAAIRDALSQDDAFIDALAEAVRNETRDSAWANEKEEALRASYRADPSVPQGVFRAVDCRRTRCSLAFDLPAVAADGLPVIDEWIAWSQPCAYVITDRAGQDARDVGDVRVFLECMR